MTKFLIGSTLIKTLYSDFRRHPKDIDYLVETSLPSVHTDEEKIEYHVNPVLFNWATKNGLGADEILTLKVSHMFWDIFWRKHMFDIVFLSEKGHKVIKPLFDELYEYWNKFHGPVKRSKLDMSADDFFNNAISKKYDHDQLHTFINPTPTYLKVLKDGAEVEVDENKFNNLSFQEKLDLVREEVYVMAFERLGNKDYMVAYDLMLKKFIMYHAPIYEALFIAQNYRILHKPHIDYVSIIKQNIKED